MEEMVEPESKKARSVPLVTVVITAYNRPDYLQESVASVLAQSFRDYEIIVIDDCSPTPLRPVLDLFERPIQYWRLPQNAGANRARNEGVLRARGRYVAFLDDDDAWLPRKLEWQLAEIGEATACIGGYEYLDSHQPFVRDVHEVDQASLKRGNAFCGMSGLVCERRWLLENPFDELLTNGQDWDIFVRLAQEAPLRYMPKPLFLYRRGSHESITTKVKKMSLKDMEQRLGAVKKHRAWLGERYYRLRVAQMLLSYIGNRKNPLLFIWAATRQGGVGATSQVLFEKLGNFLKRGGRATTH